MNKLSMGSLFDGIGGFILSGNQVGIDTLWSSEIDPCCEAVTKHHFPNVDQLGDITKIDGAKVKPVDIICGGSPCQDLSVAGKRAGLAGARSGLYMEQIRIIREMREATKGQYPRYMVWENVPGALSSNKGEDFNAVIEEAARCAEAGVSIPQPEKWKNAGCVVGNGWSVAWRIVDAQYWGVPQRRRRIFLVADFGSERAGEVLFKSESMLWDSAKGGEARKGIAADVEGSIDGSCGDDCLTPWDCQSKRIFGLNGVSSPLCAGDGGGNNKTITVAYGVTTKGNGDAFLAEERHTSLSGGGGQAGQGYPCVLEKTGEVFNESGQGYWMPEFGCLMAEGENRPTRPGHCVVQQVWPEVTGSILARADSSPCIDRGQPFVVELSVAAFMGGQGAQARSIGYSENVSPTLKTTLSGGNTVPDIVYPLVTGTICSSGAGTSRPAGQCNEGELCIVMATGQANAEIGIDVSTTLLAESHERPIRGKNERGLAARKYIIRRLTPLECDRLQGYPEVMNISTDMTKDEYIAYNLACGNIIADATTGKIYGTRGPGGIRLEYPVELTGTIVNGYKVVSIRNGNTKLQCRVNRIVWISVHGVPDPNMCVDHMNNIKPDNRIGNLQLLTPQENSTKAKTDGLYSYGEDNPHSKITQEIADAIRLEYADGNTTMRALAEKYKIGKSRVGQIINMQGWTQVKYKGKPMSDSARYRMDGNSVAIPCVVRVLGGIAAQTQV